MIILSQTFKPWCWRCILRSGEGSSPALLLYVKPQEVVQHALAIVPAKHVDGVLVGNHRVLGTASPHKLITCRHLSPSVDCLKRSKVKSKTFSCLWPIGVELCVKWSWICHDHFRKGHFFSLITSPVGHSWGVSQSSPEITKVWSRAFSRLRISAFTQNFWVFSFYIADFWQTFWVIWENGSNW